MTFVSQGKIWQVESQLKTSSMNIHNKTIFIGDFIKYNVGNNTLSYGRINSFFTEVSRTSSVATTAQCFYCGGEFYVICMIFQIRNETITFLIEIYKVKIYAGQHLIISDELEVIDKKMVVDVTEHAADFKSVNGELFKLSEEL